MRIVAIILAFAILLPLRVPGQGTVYVDDRLPLPPASIELKPHDRPATSKPWRLPKPGDKLYDAKKEAETRDAARTHTVHVFERGVFKGYAKLTEGPPR